jgi:hypothetical protein
MAAIDTPPGLGLPGTPVGWYRAHAGARRLARWCLALAVIAAAVAWLATARRPPPDRGAARVVALFTALALCGLAAAVRAARVGVAADGVRWGWGGLTVRLDAARVVRATLYRDAVALVPRRGSPWLLFARDWDGFVGLTRAVRAAGLPCEDRDGPAPWRARLQSYGRVVDGLAVVGAAVAAVTAAIAIG